MTKKQTLPPVNIHAENGKGLKAIHIFTASKDELEQARHDLNDRHLTQIFPHDASSSGLRSEIHAAILNRLQTLKL